MKGDTTVIGTLDHGLKPTVSLQQPSAGGDDSYIIAEETVIKQEEEEVVDEIVTSEDEETSDKIVLAMALVHSVVDHNKSKNKEKSRKRQRPARATQSKRIKEEPSEDRGGDSSSTDLKTRQPQAPNPPDPISSTPDVPTSASIPGISVSTASSTLTANQGKEMEPPPIITLSANSTVPNPLMNSIPSAVQQSSQENVTTDSIKPRTETSAGAPASASSAKPTNFPVTVPCPLPASTFENNAESGTKAETDHPGSEVPSDKRQVTISVETSSSQPQSRGRVFSIDLDPSFLDSMVISQEGSSSASVTDLPMLLGNGSGGTGGRNRGYSFECFAFGINADEPLPPLQDADGNSVSTRPRCDSVISARPRGDSVISARPRGDSIFSDLVSSSRPRGDSVVSRPRGDSVISRPRGDSIIFDPVSFQDGGIHEKTATMLATTRARGLSIDIDEAGVAIISANDDLDHDVGLLLTTAATDEANPEAAQDGAPVADASETPVPPPAPVSASAQAHIIVTEQPSSSTMTTLPSGINGTVTTTAAGTTTTFSMELLNKDGRIGIYLPDARKARIARFHAKRKMRIWRKRIKYDCRKKLADSRPRIKGRFVKRSDMGDD